MVHGHLNFFMFLNLWVCKPSIKLLQNVLIFRNVIALCYNNQFVALQSHVLSPRMWVVYEIITKVLSPIMLSSVLNYSHGFQLFANNLQFVIYLVETFEKH